MNKADIKREIDATEKERLKVEQLLNDYKKLTSDITNIIMLLSDTTGKLSNAQIYLKEGYTVTTNNLIDLAIKNIEYLGTMKNDLTYTIIPAIDIKKQELKSNLITLNFKITSLKDKYNSM